MPSFSSHGDLGDSEDVGEIRSRWVWFSCISPMFVCFCLCFRIIKKQKYSLPMFMIGFQSLLKKRILVLKRVRKRKTLLYVFFTKERLLSFSPREDRFTCYNWPKCFHCDWLCVDYYVDWSFRWRQRWSYFMGGIFGRPSNPFKPLEANLNGCYPIILKLDVIACFKKESLSEFRLSLILMNDSALQWLRILSLKLWVEGHCDAYCFCCYGSAYGKSTQLPERASQHDIEASKKFKPNNQEPLE